GRVTLLGCARSGDLTAIRVPQQLVICEGRCWVLVE
ncbi:hypothetical protein TIFTF001_036446, partial [Ficus carica]